jgi:hypothetical protein
LAQADGPSLAEPQGWVIDLGALRRLSALAPGTVRHFFDTPRTFVTGASTTSLRRLGLAAAIPTATFASEKALARAVSRGALPLGTRAVQLDEEHWRRTPRAEQRDPARYYQRSAQIAHDHALLFVAAPAPNLILARTPKSRGSALYTGFLSSQIAAAASRYADVYEIQAQGLESDRSAYASFVHSVAFQASQAHPGVELLAGISANPSSRHRPLGLLLGATGASGPAVSGFALSDPPGRRSCPACAGQYDATTVAFLRGLRRQGL